MSGVDAVGWYDANAADVSADYERLPFELVHDWLQDFIPEKSGLALDVGAGSGRDAAALAEINTSRAPLAFLRQLRRVDAL